MTVDLDQRVRLAAFKFLDARTTGSAEELLSRADLQRGFDFEGKRVSLASPQGIFTPALLDVPLSILTVAVEEGETRPYDDVIGEDGLLRYRYRGTDIRHRDNVGLRTAMAKQTPLVYFHGIVRGRYLPCYPVFIVGDDPSSLTFTVNVDERRFVGIGDLDDIHERDIRRRYATRIVQQRLHQQEFRERVLEAYHRTCAVCRLKRQELLDAAHIISDATADGVASVTNGISLCKLHHSAFDANILGIRPDYTIHIREDVLHEVDGPMLIHGLQGWNGMRLSTLPTGPRRPDPKRLETRYQSFLAAHTS